MAKKPTEGPASQPCQAVRCPWVGLRHPLAASWLAACGGRTRDQVQGFFKKQTHFLRSPWQLGPIALRWRWGRCLCSNWDREWVGLTEQLVGDGGFGRCHTEESGLTGRCPPAHRWDGTTGNRGETRNVETAKPVRNSHGCASVNPERVERPLPAQPWLGPSTRRGPHRHEHFPFLPKLQCEQDQTSHQESVLQELVSGKPSSGASWALACRWARAELECRHLGDPQRQLNSLPLMSQKRCP